MKNTAIYIRCSTKEQDTDRQRYELKKYIKNYDELKLYDIFDDSGVSADSKEKPEFERMMNLVRSGNIDTIVVSELSRLGRSVKSLCDLVDELKQLDVTLIVKNQNLDTSSPQGRMFFHLIAMVAEYERELLSERIKSKLAYLKEKGVKVGRPTNLTNDIRNQILYLRSKKVGIQKICKQVKVGINTVYKVMEEAS